MARKVGRPSKFDPEKAKEIEKLARDGLTNSEIAKIIGVSDQTFYNLKRYSKEFLYALNKGKLEANRMVEAALFHKATGYSHPETKAFSFEGQIITEEVIKHYPPDTEAAKFWLKNKDPENWKDKTETDFGDEGLKIVIESYIKKETSK